MEKLMNLRRSGRCNKCKQTIHAGERAYWHGKGGGISHVSCRNENPKSPVKQATKVVDSAYDHSWSWMEVRTKFNELCAGKHEGLSPVNNDFTRYLFGIWESDSRWVGATINEMKEWLEIGFKIPGLDDVNTLIQGKPKRKSIRSTEGDEFIYELWMDGEEDCFMEWEKQNKKPGLKVEINIAYSASIKPENVVKYQRWCARMLQTLDEAAIDMQVSLVNRVKGLTTGDYSKVWKTSIRVKDSGIAGDFVSWSPCISPGGFRQMMFLAKVLSANAEGLQTDRSLGVPCNPDKFSVEYDEESNTLQVFHSNSNEEFPEHAMTESLREIMDKVSG